jgi:uncharacterized protein YcfJ
MRKVVLGLAALSIIALPSMASAQQDGAAAGAITGGVTGAVVGGPVGAAVGAGVGAIAGGVAADAAQRDRTGSVVVAPGGRTGAGCASTTTRQTGPMGESTSVTQERCND